MTVCLPFLCLPVVPPQCADVRGNKTVPQSVFFFRPPLTFQYTTSRHIVSVQGFGGGVVGIAVLGIAVLCRSAGYFLSISLPI